MEELTFIREGFEAMGMIVKFLFTTPGLRLFVWIPLIGLIIETVRRILRR